MNNEFNIDLWISKLNKREVSFLLYLFQQNYPKLIIDNNHSYLKSIINQIEFNLYGYYPNVLNNTLKGGLVPQNYLDWIIEDLRNSIWFYGYYEFFPLANYICFQLNPMPSFIDNLIFNIDIATLTNNYNELNRNQYFKNMSFPPIDINNQGTFQKQENLSEINDKEDNTSNLQTMDLAAKKYREYTDLADSKIPKYENLTTSQYQALNTENNLTQSETIDESIEIFDSNKHLDNITPYHQQSLYGLSEKTEYFNRARVVFIETRTHPKDLEWIDKSNHSQLIWAIDYLKKNNFLISPLNFYPNDAKQMFAQICASIDLIAIREKIASQNLTYSPIQELFLQKMRNSWHQKNFRDKKESNSALQSIMSKKEYMQLEKLSRYHGLKPLEFINQLVDSEFQSIFKR